MTTEWIDYPIDLTRLDGRAEDIARCAITGLFVAAARQGWDIEHDDICVMRRVKRWDATIRLARCVPPDMVQKWTQRGWSVVPFGEGVRVLMSRLLPPKAII